MRRIISTTKPFHWVLVCWLRRAGRTKAGRCGHCYGGRTFVLRQAGEKAHVKHNGVCEPKPQCLGGSPS